MEYDEDDTIRRLKRITFLDLAYKILQAPGSKGILFEDDYHFDLYIRQFGWTLEEYNKRLRNE